MTLTTEKAVAERNKPVRRMYCTCCGGVFSGRQWANQDTGHGLGDCCVESVSAKYRHDDTQTFAQCYGIEGIHYNIGQPPIGMLAMQAFGVRLPLTVLKAPKGFFLGTFDEEGPVSRESVEYWAVEADAITALQSSNTDVQSWTQRTEA